MVKELGEYENHQPTSTKTKATQDMLNMMNGYYKDLKAEVGIEESSGLNDKDDTLDEILR